MSKKVKRHQTRGYWLHASVCDHDVTTYEATRCSLAEAFHHTYSKRWSRWIIVSNSRGVWAMDMSPPTYAYGNKVYEIGERREFPTKEAAIMWAVLQ